ncbi:MAG: GNAT family N-acetyltransferase [Ardenticatenales bacterium]|nr:GNAT family N-acetyltransferase [Ardenticatenales bacterium]
MFLESERLRLIACPAAVARAAIEERGKAARLLGAALDEAWPGPELQDFLPFYAEMVEEDDSLLSWGIWLIVEHASQTVIGDVGFKGKPDETGSVELGYSVVPTFRRQGYASEAAECLLRWTVAVSDVTHVRAECLAENLPSIRTLEKLGFTRVSEEGEMLLWEKL